MSDPFGDLRAVKPDPKRESAGGTGKKKPKPPQSAAQVEKHAKKNALAKKCRECRVCPNPRQLPVEAHHIVRRPQVSADVKKTDGMWHVNNVLGLCLECHVKYHAGDAATREAIRKSLTAGEVEYSIDAGHHDYVDKNYFRLPKNRHGQPTVWAEEAA